tara:strand:+ start:677 stop:1630 length:954 start_codon:yes stop_codon:yes gene_type:complete
MTEYLSDQWDGQRRDQIVKPTVITIGTFDGLHRGHREVISKICNRAKAVGKKSLLVTFRPHPLSIISTGKAPALLTSYDEKKEILTECGIDYVVFLPFNNDLANYDPREFVKDFLIDRFGLSELIVGYDHRFGKGGAGDTHLLKTLGKEMDFSVEVVPPLLKDGRPISSSAVRGCLSSGDVRSASENLGRLYSFVGEVVAGDKRGRKLGFPTANIKVSNEQDEVKLIPLEGIYAVIVQVGRKQYSGALHIGPRPTFLDPDKVIELYIIDFKADIYGKKIKVECVEYIRDITSFESAIDLISQMNNDVERVREILEER